MQIPLQGAELKQSQCPGHQSTRELRGGVPVGAGGAVPGRIRGMGSREHGTRGQALQILGLTP